VAVLIYDTATQWDPAAVEVQDVATGVVLYSGTVDDTVGVWVTIRAELNQKTKEAALWIGESLLGTWPVSIESLQATHIGLSAYSNCCALTQAGWQQLLVETGVLSQEYPDGCDAPKCGDGLVNNVFEACDDGNSLADDGCSPACQEEPDVLIVEGPFWMGCDPGLDASCTAHAQPAHQVYLTDYFIDRYEVTVEQYQGCVDAGICNGNTVSDGPCNFGKSDREKHPMNCLGWQDAAVYCAWLGKGLPTEAQWEKAAKGGCDLFDSQECASVFPKYPWGNEPLSCNLAAVSGCGPSSTGSTIGGAHPSGVSVYGIHDMTGNVSEWVRDWYSPFFYSVSSTINPLGPNAGAQRSVRGGSYKSAVFGSPVALAIWYRDAMAPASLPPSTGFRCVKAGK
jgi:cysteine-rich repeat protein